MNLLEGSIAFVLALAGFATLCTVLIEILHRLAGLRWKGLRLMLDAYIDDVVKSHLPASELNLLRADLIAKLTNSALLEKIHPVPPGWRGLVARTLGMLYRKRLLQANVVTTAEFLQRLPESALFKQFKAQSAQEADALLRQLADKYDQYGAAASDYFKRRAQLLSILAGIALALFANIQGLRLYETFVRNPELVQRMQAQADTIKLAIDQQTAVSAGNAAADAKADAKVQVPQAQADLAQVKASLIEYQAIGLPIGWNYYPNCLAAGANDPPCLSLHLERANEARPSTFKSIRLTLGHDPAAALAWLVAIILTGILIGLGGPFWFDLAMRLSKVKQAIDGRAPTQPAAAALSARDQAIANAASQLAPPPQTPQGAQPWNDKPW